MNAHATAAIPASGRATTPSQIRALLHAAWVAAAIFAATGAAVVSGAREALQEIGRDAAPSAVAAGEVRAALADIDAAAALSLLGGAARREAADRAFADRRAAVAARLVDAAAAREPVAVIVDGLGRYLERIGESRRREDGGDHAGAVLVYEGASADLHRQLSPAAAALAEGGEARVDRAYRALRDRGGARAVFAALAGALLLAALAAAQIFCFRRMRRVFNPPLLAATALTLAATALLAARLADTRDDLGRARAPHFAVVTALSRARALACDARGDQARALLDPAQADRFEFAYHEATSTITRLLGDAGLGAGSADHDAGGRVIEGFAAVDRAAAQIRERARGGRRDAAVDLAVGAASDQAGAAFADFDRALLAVVADEQRAFKADVDARLRAFSFALAAGPAAAALAAVLAFLGLRPRLQEYAG